MNLYRIAAGIAAFGFATIVGAGSALASQTVNSPAASIVIIKWKTNATASLVVQADYVLATALTNATPGTITLGTATPSTNGGACGAAGATASNTLDYGAITPDQVVPINCLYQQAVVAKVGTNSTSWTLTQYLSAVAGAGFTLCAAPGANQTALPLTYAAPAANTIANTCAGANTLTAVSPGIAYGSGSTTGTTYVPEDLGLIVAANAPVTTQSGINLTLQLIAN